MITVVSGLPRSGTSLMMQILEAGGLKIHSDGRRKPDESNPKGYYEFEKVKSLQKDNSWLHQAEGKAIKVIAQLIQYLPRDYDYRFLFMERDLDEIINSQNKMIAGLGGKSSVVNSDVLKTTFIKQLENVKTLLSGRSNFTTFYINYNKLVRKDTDTIESLKSALNDLPDIDKGLNAIDPGLYRNRQI